MISISLLSGNNKVVSINQFLGSIGALLVRVKIVINPWVDGKGEVSKRCLFTPICQTKYQ